MGFVFSNNLTSVLSRGTDCWLYLRMRFWLSLPKSCISLRRLCNSSFCFRINSLSWSCELAFIFFDGGPLPSLSLFSLNAAHLLDWLMRLTLLLFEHSKWNEIIEFNQLKQQQQNTSIFDICTYKLFQYFLIMVTEFRKSIYIKLWFGTIFFKKATWMITLSFTTIEFPWLIKSKVKIK